MGGEPGPIQFARSRGFRIALQEFGEGPSDLVLVWGRPNHLETVWEWPALARWLRGLGQFGRVVHLDLVGTGLSDRVAASEIPDLDEQAADVVAVLDAAGMQRVTLVGESEGTCCAVRLATNYPDRVERLILLAPAVRGLIPDEFRTEVLDLIEERWGTPLMVELQFPGLADDPRFGEWYATLLRRAASPREARAMLELDADMDEVPRLAEIQAPTLMVAQADDVFLEAEDLRDWASRVPVCTLALVPGGDRTFGTGRGSSDPDALAVIAEFLGHEPVADSRIDRRRRAILFTDIVGSTALAATLGDEQWRRLLDEHDRIMAKLAHRFGSDWFSSTGDGIATTLPDAPAALQMAREGREALAALDLAIRAGIHVGDVELRGGERAGIDIHIAARIADLADTDQTLISESTLALLSDDVPRTPAGAHELKGVPGSWVLWSVG